MSTDLREPIFAFSHRLVDEFARVFPMQATMAGIPGDHDGWDDWSPAGCSAALAFLQDAKRELDALPRAATTDGRLAEGVVSDYLDDRISYFESGDCLCDVNNIESPVQQLRMVFDMMDTSSQPGWEAIARRLSTIGEAIAGYCDALSEGRRRGHVAAKRQVEAAIAQANLQSSDASSFLGLLEQFDAGEFAGNASIRARLVAGVEQAQRGYGALSAYLRDYLSAAAARDAFGTERYARSAQRFLGMAIDPLETYAWGFSEIRRIEAEMRRLSERIAPGKSTREVVAMLENDPAQIVGDAEAFLEAMRARQAKALADLQGAHFDVPEAIQRIEVKLAPEGGALGAYYVPPSEDFSRPGTVYYAPGADATFRLFAEITTAYHEGFPGHHLQCGLQVHFADRLCRLHRLFVVHSGYAEGWALYAEQLMDELGYFDEPAYVLGMHMAKLFRAYRVVADIGMHLELSIPDDFDFRPGTQWDWQTCVDVLVERTFAARDHAESEATRYLGWPGQAISYKVGERVILELREEARRRLGERFDLRAFHNAVLSTGSVGLDRLRREVRRELFGEAASA